MTEETHDIPPWLIPDEEQVIANEPEKEQIEEEGGLEESLCPHCGHPYKKQEDDKYIHAWRYVESGSNEVEPKTWCDTYQKRCHADQFPWGADF